MEEESIELYTLLNFVLELFFKYKVTFMPNNHYN